MSKSHLMMGLGPFSFSQSKTPDKTGKTLNQNQKVKPRLTVRRLGLFQLLLLSGRLNSDWEPKSTGCSSYWWRPPTFPLPSLRVHTQPGPASASRGLFLLWPGPGVWCVTQLMMVIFSARASGDSPMFEMGTPTTLALVDFDPHALPWRQTAAIVPVPDRCPAFVAQEPSSG